MDKIKIFKEKALAIEVDVMQDYYPGNPIYIGKDSDEKRDEYLKKYAAENNIELPKAEGALHYYPVYTSESQMESYYNDTIFSIPDMSLDYLSSALKELEAYSYKELFDAINVLSSRFANDEIMCSGARHDAMRFKNIFNRQFKNKLPIAGRITSFFIGSMRKEIRLKEKYLEMLTNKVKDVIDIKLGNIKKVTQLTSLTNTDSKIFNDKFEVKKKEVSNSVTNSNNTKKTPQIKTLFNFIAFLHDNIDNFNEYDNTIRELKKKIERYSQLGFHYTEKSERDALEKEINEDLDVLLKNIINPIKEKVTELELFDWELPRTFSKNYFEIANRLCKTYNDKDLDAILKAKTQYIEFTNKISPRVIQQAEKVFEYLYETMIEIAINFPEKGDVSIKYEKVKRAESFEELVKGFKAREKLSKPRLASSAATIDSQSAPIASIFETDFSETNTIELINTDTIKDINFERIFAAALAYEDDPTEMKEFCIREQKKADRDYFYKKDHFYKSLLKVVVKVKEQVKFNQKPHPERKHVGSFFIAGGGRSYEYGSVVLLEQIVNEMLCEDKVPQEELASLDKSWGETISQLSNAPKAAKIMKNKDDITLKEKHREGINTNPPSLDIPLSDDELKKHFYELVTSENRILHYKTDYHHFAYAISGHALPKEKQPYEVIKLSDYNNRFYYYLNEEIVQAQLKKPQKCLPNLYRKKAKELFYNKNGKPLKLSNPT